MHRGYEKSDPWDALNVHMALGALRHCSCEMQHANMLCAGAFKSDVCPTLLRFTQLLASCRLTVTQPCLSFCHMKQMNLLQWHCCSSWVRQVVLGEAAGAADHGQHGATLCSTSTIGKAHLFLQVVSSDCVDDN